MMIKMKMMMMLVVVVVVVLLLVVAVVVVVVMMIMMMEVMMLMTVMRKMMIKKKKKVCFKRISLILIRRQVVVGLNAAVLPLTSIMQVGKNNHCRTDNVFTDSQLFRAPSVDACFARVD